MLARVSLAQHQADLALELLTRFRSHLDQPGDLPNALEWQALSVTALHLNGQHEQAVRAAARLVLRTEPENAIRLYLDEGPPMRQVLQRLLAQLERPEAPREEREPASDGLSPQDGTLTRAFLRRVLAAFEQEDHPYAAHLSPARPPHHSLRSPTPADAPRPPAEPLSRQEQRVLRLLVAGQTYAQIAGILVVSPNTIKTQVSSIYRKLGVSNRAQAIMAAQRRSLLLPDGDAVPSSDS